MCGIAGIISLNGERLKNAESRTKSMLKAMKYRGPDGSGTYTGLNGRVVLGNNRLAITDPDYPINGPYANDNKRFVLAYNGEIYDYKEHRNKLKKKGINFTTKTDTEVLLKGFINKNLDFLQDIDGCWSFAILDQLEEKIIISRDLLGEKQLFYYKTKEEFIFSSEAAPLLEIINNKIELNVPEVLNSIRFHSSSLGNTIIKGIKKLSPGHALIFNLQKKTKISEKLYINFDFISWDDFFKSNPSDEKVMDKLSELLFLSVKNRLPTDIPFVTTLSGGIDSTLISYFASLHNKNINTLYAQTSEELVTYKNELNEKEASRYTSKKLKTNHNEIVLSPEDTVEMLKSNAESSVDGLFDWGTVSFQILGESIKKYKFKSLLVSEGADEFCGYNNDLHNFLVYSNNKNNIIFGNLFNLANKNIIIRKIFRRFEYARRFTYDPYCSFKPIIFRPHHEAIGLDFMCKFFRRSVLEVTNSTYGKTHSIQGENNLDFTQKMSLSYAQLSLPDYSNLRLDKGLMRCSIEPRMPFLNKSLVNFFLAMPSKYRYRNGYSKYILRRLVDRHIGKKIAWRKKHGFSYPIWKLKELGKSLISKIIY